MEMRARERGRGRTRTPLAPELRRDPVHAAGHAAAEEAGKRRWEERPRQVREDIFRDRPLQAAVGHQLPQQAEPPSLGRKIGEERAEEAGEAAQELVAPLPSPQTLN